jgi:uncharacterized protein (TIGR02145 family)
MWRIATDSDFKILEGTIDSTYPVGDPEWDFSNIDRGANAGALLSGTFDIWSDGDLRNNVGFGDSGFNFVPSGMRFDDGEFGDIGDYGYLWLATEGDNADYFIRLVSYDTTKITRYEETASSGMPIRLVRDIEESEESDQDGTIYEEDYTGNDGKKYDSVKIGNQIWINENLKETKYYDSSTIPIISSDEDWASDISGARCFYNNDSDNEDTYGFIYNAYVMLNEKGLVNISEQEKKNITIGSTNIGDIKLGSTQILSAYKGSSLLWEKQ